MCDHSATIYHTRKNFREPKILLIAVFKGGTNIRDTKFRECNRS